VNVGQALVLPYAPGVTAVLFNVIVVAAALPVVTEDVIPVPEATVAT
jgi:hypothetical protein